MSAWRAVARPASPVKNASRASTSFVTGTCVRPRTCARAGTARAHYEQWPHRAPRPPAPASASARPPAASGSRGLARRLACSARCSRLRGPRPRRPPASLRRRQARLTAGRAAARCISPGMTQSPCGASGRIGFALVCMWRDGGGVRAGAARVTRGRGTGCGRMLAQGVRHALSLCPPGPPATRSRAAPVDAVGAGLDAAEHVRKGTRDDAAVVEAARIATHGERFSRAGLRCARQGVCGHGQLASGEAAGRSPLPPSPTVAASRQPLRWMGRSRHPCQARSRTCP